MAPRGNDDRVHSIFAVLTRAHRAVATLFAQLEALPDDDAEARAELFTELQGLLLAHSRAEAEVVYARFARFEPLAEAVREARQAHRQVERLLDEIEDLDPEDPAWTARVVVLKELVARHVEAEEGLLFELARPEIDAAESSRLAAEFAATIRRVTEDDDLELDEIALDEIAHDRWDAEAPPLAEHP